MASRTDKQLRELLVEADGKIRAQAEEIERLKKVWRAREGGNKHEGILRKGLPEVLEKEGGANGSRS